MPDDAEACGAISLQEAVGVRPSVEAHAKAVTLKDAEHFGEGWLEPCVVVVVRHGTPVTRLVTGDIRRAREYEIHAARAKL